ncbi:hypothetical protein ACROYT_G029583 [Oculina patagonica]
MGNEVHFKLCPQGYCCPAVNKTCHYDNSSYLNSGCQGNRTGILCGRCKQNFSETLFTKNCLPVKDCTHWWYLLIIFIFMISFALFLIRKPPVVEILMANLTWFLPRHRRKDHDDYKSLDSEAKTDSSSSKSGFLKILFYFYQVAGVLTASYYGVSEVLKDNIALPVMSLLDFKVSVNNDWRICPFPGITPLSKTLFQLAAVTATGLSIPAIYLLHSGLNKLRKRTPVLPPSGPYLGATLEILLLGYSAATGTAMKLLKCVEIQHVSRWYYDAEITCNHWWHTAAIMGIALYLVPFIFALYFASFQLYRGQISAKIFILVCFFPLPYLLLLFIAYVVKVIRHCQEKKSPCSIFYREDDKDTYFSFTTGHPVLEVLTAPFCKPEGDRLSGRIHWECVLIGRRFILIVIGSLLTHAFLRTVCLTILCLFFLLHHVYQKPFAQFRENLAETVSLTTLVVIATLNVGLTSYYSEGTETSDFQAQYVQGFLLTEAVLLCAVPLVFAVFVSLSLISQLVRLAAFVENLHSHVVQSGDSGRMDFWCVLWLLFLSGFCSYGNVFAKQWFVSRLQGSSALDCGLQSSRPCKTIHQVTSRAHEGDVINIDGAGTSRDPYPCESINSTGEKELKTASVVMRSNNSRAFIACKNNSFRFSCDTSVNASYGVSLRGITFVNTALHLDECSLKMTDCSFVNGSSGAVSLNFSQNSAGNIDLDGCSFQNNSASGLKISGNSVKLIISNSSFTNNKLCNESDTLLTMSAQTLQVQEIAKFTVNFTNLTVSQNKCSGLACFEIVAGVKRHLTLEMNQVTFENNEAGESILDIRNSSNANVEFKSTNFKKNAGRAVKLQNGNLLELKIVKGTFVENSIGHRGNGGAVSVSGFAQIANVSLSRSNFTSNKAEIGGACSFQDMFLLILDIESCQFEQNKAWISGGAITVGNQSLPQINATIDIRNSNFSGNILQSESEDEAEGGGALTMNISHAQSLSLTNNTFIVNKAKGMHTAGAIYAVIFTLNRDAVVSNCNFTRNSGDSSMNSAIQLEVLNYSFQPRIILQNSTFSKNKGRSSFCDICLLSSILVIRFCKIQNNSGGGIYFGTLSSPAKDMLVENSIISDNVNFQLGLCMAGNEGRIGNRSKCQFKNVAFINNNCTTKGSIFQVFMNTNQSLLLFQANKFLNNFCESGVFKISLPSVKSVVTINNTEFCGNSGVSESTLTIRDVEKVDIQNSNFTNNFGGTDGSHMRVQMRTNGELTIYKTNFYQFEKSQVYRASKEKPYNGFLTVTSAGNMTIRESSFVLDPPSRDGKILILVKGVHKVVMNDSVQIKSPVSSKLLLHNFSHLEEGPNSKTQITSFSLITEPCPIGTYSINRGSSNGFTIEKNPNCLICPTGGNCTYSLSARHNYWGYPMGNEVYFELCPQGYCCPAVNQTCAYNISSYRHSGCQGNRTGFLCGGCKQNFSETLFTTNCHPLKDCTDWWYLIIIFIFIISFALFLIRKPPVFEILMLNLTWFLPRHRRKDHDDYNSLDGDAKTDSTSSKSGFLKILFYFYQVAGVLTASYYGVSEVLKDNIALPVMSLLDFKVSVNNDWRICPFPGITPLSKTLFQLAAVTATGLSIPAIYLLHSGLNKVRKRTPVLPPSGPYFAATLEILLLGYSAATGTAMKLLKCVEIQNVSRWYYDAEITCNQWWHTAAIVGIALNLVPFIFALYFASFQLYRGQISAKVFILVCFFPLPYLLFLFIAYVVKVIRHCQEKKSPCSIFCRKDDKDTSFSFTTGHPVLEVLTAPFCKPEGDRLSGRIHWECVLIGRRFILIVIGSVLPHAFLRTVCLTILCLFFLLHHVSRKPFVQFRDNLAETVSLTTLVVIATLNVGLTSYYSEGTEARGVQKQSVQWFYRLAAKHSWLSK